MKRNATPFSSLIPLIALLVFGPGIAPVRADVVTVHVFCCGYSINPSGQPIVQPTIHPGDTIHWVWDEVSPQHSVTSLSGSAETFDSGLHASAFTFDHVFNSVGVFKYYCVLHGIDNHDGTATGMWGSITVVSPVKVSALALAAASVPGTKATTGTVTLSAAAPTGGFTVDLTSSNAVASVPASIIVAAGATTGKFTIKTKSVTVATKSNITASGGGASFIKTLTVKPVGVKALVLGPDAVVGGDSTMGAVVLEAPAPAGGVTVTLSSSTALAGVPASISIPAGSITGTFAITSTATSSAGSSVIKAIANGLAKTATLAVLP